MVKNWIKQRYLMVDQERWARVCMQAKLTGHTVSEWVIKAIDAALKKAQKKTD